MEGIAPKLILIVLCIGVSVVAYCSAAVGVLLVKDLFLNQGKTDKYKSA